MFINEQAIQRKFVKNDRLPESLTMVGVQSTQDILKSFAGNRENTVDWLYDYQPNQDQNFRLEYLAGLSLDVRVEQRI